MAEDRGHSNAHTVDAPPDDVDDDDDSPKLPGQICTEFHTGAGIAEA